MSNAQNGHNRNGGLTLVPMPGFENLAKIVRGVIREKKNNPTPTDIALPKFGTRSSGEPFLRLPKRHIGGHDCVVLTSGPGTYKMVVETQMLLGYLAGRRAGRITLVTGYLPLSRSDKDEGEEELALTPLFVRFFQGAADNKLDRIIAVDLHSPQAVMAAKPGFITEVSLMRRQIDRAVETELLNSDKLVIMYPDEGARKRYESQVTTTLEASGIEQFPSVFGLKRRSSSKKSKTLELYGDLGALPSATVICVDDEAATLGTLESTASIVLNRYNANRFCAVVIHPVLCGSGPKLLATDDCPISCLYATDTILVNRPELDNLIASGKIIIQKWAHDLANIVYHHHWDTSIRTTR